MPKKYRPAKTGQWVLEHRQPCVHTPRLPTQSPGRRRRVVELQFRRPGHVDVAARRRRRDPLPRRGPDWPRRAGPLQLLSRPATNRLRDITRPIRRTALFHRPIEGAVEVATVNRWKEAPPREKPDNASDAWKREAGKWRDPDARRERKQDRRRAQPEVRFLRRGNLQMRTAAGPPSRTPMGGFPLAG